MNWKEKTVAKILLIIAKMLVDKDSELYKELKSLESHISVGAWTREDRV